MLAVPHTVVSADGTVTHSTFKMTPAKAQTLHASAAQTDAFLRIKMPSKGFYKSWRRFGAWNLNDEDDTHGNNVPHSLLFAWVYGKGTTPHGTAYVFGDAPDEAHVEAFDDMLLLRVRVDDNDDSLHLSRALPMTDEQVSDWRACVAPFDDVGDVVDVAMDDSDTESTGSTASVDDADDAEEADDPTSAPTPNTSVTPAPPPPTTSDDTEDANDDEAADTFFDEDDEDDGGAVDTIEDDDDEPNDDEDDDDTYDDDVCAPDALGFEDYAYDGEHVSCGLDTASVSWTSYRPYLGKMSSSFTSTTNKRRAKKKGKGKKQVQPAPVQLRGEPLRQRVREALVAVYTRGGTEHGLCDAEGADGWATNVEKGIYNSVVQKAIEMNVLRKWDNDRFADVYYQRVKTVTSNLDPRSYVHAADATTRLLARTLPQGDLRPHEVAFLTPAQMQPARWAQLQEAHARKQKEYVPTDFVTLYRCAKCGERKTTVCEMQTRSADEAMTLFITCFSCKHRWRK